MAKYSERNRRRRYGGKIAIAAGVIVALIGLYFILGISRSTDRKNALCTEETTGTVTDCTPSGSGYSTTVEYTPGYSPMSITLTTKQSYETGTEVPVNYQPDSFTRVYIEGMTPTGKKDMVQGIVFLLAGAVLAALGAFLDRLRKR